MLSAWTWAGLISPLVCWTGNVVYWQETRGRPKHILGSRASLYGLLHTVRTVAEKENVPLARIKGIGIASPGVLDIRKGMVPTAFNLPGWQNIPLRDILKRKLDCPVILGHDAAMATLGEHRCGAGRGVDNLVCITLGTGVGIGLIIDGKLYERSTGDLGHMKMTGTGRGAGAGATAALKVMRAVRRLRRRG